MKSLVFFLAFGIVCLGGLQINPVFASRAENQLMMQASRMHTRIYQVIQQNPGFEQKIWPAIENLLKKRNLNKNTRLLLENILSFEKDYQNELARQNISNQSVVQVNILPEESPSSPQTIPSTPTPQAPISIPQDPTPPVYQPKNTDESAFSFPGNYAFCEFEYQDPTSVSCSGIGELQIQANGAVVNASPQYSVWYQGKKIIESIPQLVYIGGDMGPSTFYFSPDTQTVVYDNKAGDGCGFESTLTVMREGKKIAEIKTFHGGDDLGQKFSITDGKRLMNLSLQTKNATQLKNILVRDSNGGSKTIMSQLEGITYSDSCGEYYPVRMGYDLVYKYQGLRLMINVKKEGLVLSVPFSDL